MSNTGTYTEEQFVALPRWAQVEILALENQLLKKTLQVGELLEAIRQFAAELKATKS